MKYALQVPIAWKEPASPPPVQMDILTRTKGQWLTLTAKSAMQDTIAKAPNSPHPLANVKLGMYVPRGPPPSTRLE